jgi:hypothetical protein
MDRNILTVWQIYCNAGKMSGMERAGKAKKQINN